MTLAPRNLILEVRGLRKSFGATEVLKGIDFAVEPQERQFRVLIGRKTRSLVNLGMLTALNRSTELAAHVRGAVNNGATKEEIQEVLLQTAVYCGLPAALEAARLAQAAVEEYEK